MGQREGERGNGRGMVVVEGGAIARECWGFFFDVRDGYGPRLYKTSTVKKRRVAEKIRRRLQMSLNTRITLQRIWESVPSQEQNNDD